MERKKLERLDARIFRSLSLSEARRVGGSRIIGTETLCTLHVASNKIDGDLHEC